jgi:hypothetical protein
MALEDIAHIVVLMLENRSFDCMLGKLYPKSAEFDGLSATEANEDLDGTPVAVWNSGDTSQASINDGPARIEALPYAPSPAEVDRPHRPAEQAPAGSPAARSPPAGDDRDRRFQFIHRELPGSFARRRRRNRRQLDLRRVVVGRFDQEPAGEPVQKLLIARATGRSSLICVSTRAVDTLQNAEDDPLDKMKNFHIAHRPSARRPQPHLEN